MLGTASKKSKNATGEKVMLIETAIGDAMGLGFEYVPQEITELYNDLSAYRAHPKHPLLPGQYSDDTQMSIGTAEAVLAIRGGATPSRELFTHHYLQAFWRDVRPGYAQRFYDFLLTVGSVEDFLARIKPTSEKSGAAMRAGPLGVFEDPHQVKYLAELQASLTHDTPLGRAAAVAAALMTNYFLYDRGPRSKLGTYLDHKVPIESWRWQDERAEKVGAAGWQSVAAAVSAIQRFDSLSDCLRWVVGLRGDVDTAAAICMAAASCSREIHQDLPAHLYTGLENGNFGRDYLLELDHKLGLT